MVDFKAALRRIQHEERMATKTAKRRKGTVVDFTGVQAGGLTIPDGRYKAKIIDWAEKEGNDSGEAYVQLEWEITSEKCNGRSIKFDNHSLQPQALPFLRAVLEALEYEIEESADFVIDWDQLIKDETECIIETVAVPSTKDPSQKFARITGFYPLSDGNTVDDEEGDSKAGKSTGGGKKPSVETDDEDEDDEPPKRRGKKDEEEEDDEDEEEERPTSKKLKKGAKVKFKDEKGKLLKGKVQSIDGDLAIVETEDEDQYELELDDLTVIG